MGSVSAEKKAYWDGASVNPSIMSWLWQAKILESRCARIVVSYNGKKAVRC